MDKSEKGKKYALIAAICYSAIAIYLIINRIVYAHNNPEHTSIPVVTILTWIIFIGFAVFLFIKNKKALLVVAGANTILDIYHMLNIYFLSQNSDFVFYLFDFFAYAASFFAYTALIIILILALKANSSSTRIWFLAAALLFVGSVIKWMSYGSLSYIISTAWKSILKNIIECFALMLSGMWIKNDLSPAEITQTHEYASFNPQAIGVTQAKVDAIGGADKLKMYKELLDSGTITQEEFDQKKKQVLGL